MPRLLADRAVLHASSELGRVVAGARARERSGARIVHLERGEPDFDTPPHIVDALARAARDGATHYPDMRGEPALREALAGKLARENGLDAHPDDVVITVGGTHALFLAFQALLGAGDELLALSPHWMAIPQLVAFVDGARLRELPAVLELHAGTLDPAGLADRLRAALRPETRGFYLNTPHNPTGLVLSREALQTVADVAIERDLWVVSDEAYEHLVFDGARHVSLGSLPGMAGRTISAFTFSKSYAMTGWRVGYVHTPPALRAVMGPILGFYSTHGVFPAAQLAALAAVTGPQDDVTRMRDAYAARRDVLLAGLGVVRGVTVPRPQGAFYAFANVAGPRAGRDPWTLADEWLDHGVAALPGVAFGASYADWVRLSLAAREDDVAEGARRIAAACGTGART